MAVVPGAGGAGGAGGGTELGVDTSVVDRGEEASVVQVDTIGVGVTSTGSSDEVQSSGIAVV